MPKWISYPVPTRPGDLPNLTDEQLLAQGFVTGFRAKRVGDDVATMHLAASSGRAAGWKCHASTQAEIDATTAREAAVRDAFAAGGNVDVHDLMNDTSPR
jgi:hypothetical protein